MYDIYRTDPTQETCPLARRLHGSHPATMLRRSYLVQIRNLNALNDLDREVGVDDLYDLYDMYDMYDLYDLYDLYDTDHLSEV